MHRKYTISEIFHEVGEKNGKIGRETPSRVPLLCLIFFINGWELCSCLCLMHYNYTLKKKQNCYLWTKFSQEKQFFIL
jgi:hypothetical protein